jgi:hypothetical protein
MYCSASCRVVASRVRKQATIRAFAEYTGKLEHEAADIADSSRAALKGMQIYLAGRGLTYQTAQRAWVADVAAGTGVPDALPLPIDVSGHKYSM